MILVNVSSETTITSPIGDKILTITVGQESPNMILGDDDVRRLIQRVKSDLVKFKVTNPQLDMDQLARCGVDPSYIYQDSSEEE